MWYPTGDVVFLQPWWTYCVSQPSEGRIASASASVIKRHLQGHSYSLSGAVLQASGRAGWSLGNDVYAGYTAPMKEEGFYLAAPEMRIWSPPGIPAPFVGFYFESAGIRDIYIRAVPLTPGELGLNPPRLPLASLFFRGRLNTLPETVFAGAAGTSKDKLSIVPLEAEEALAIVRIWRISEACVTDAFRVLTKAILGEKSWTWQEAYSARQRWP